MMVLGLFLAAALAHSPVAHVAFSYASDAAPSSAASPDADSAPRHAAAPVARGFGQSVPLSFAIRQIVPTRHEITVEDTIDQTQKVSWTGGKPWPAALHDLISPLGLHFTLRGNIVKISR